MGYTCIDPKYFISTHAEMQCCLFRVQNLQSQCIVLVIAVSWLIVSASYFHCNSSLPNAAITLFQLITLDQWYTLYQDLIKVSNETFTCVYIVLWISIGAFMFQNLFVGILGASLTITITK